MENPTRSLEIDLNAIKQLSFDFQEKVTWLDQQITSGKYKKIQHDDQQPQQQLQQPQQQQGQLQQQGQIQDIFTIEYDFVKTNFNTFLLQESLNCKDLIDITLEVYNVLELQLNALKGIVTEMGYYTPSTIIEPATIATTPITYKKIIQFTSDSCAQKTGISTLDNTPSNIHNTRIFFGSQFKKGLRESTVSIDSLPPPPILSSNVDSNLIDSPNVATTIKSNLALSLCFISDNVYAKLKPHLKSQITRAYLNDVITEINDLVSEKRFTQNNDHITTFTLAELESSSKLSKVRLIAVIEALGDCAMVSSDTSDLEAVVYQIK